MRAPQPLFHAYRDSVRCGDNSVSVLTAPLAGLAENEICPVFTAMTSDDIAAHPDEVMEWEWVSPKQLITAVNAASDQPVADAAAAPALPAEELISVR